MHDDDTLEDGGASRRHWLKAIGAGAGVAALGAVGASAALATPASASAAATLFVPITPYRVMDTRAGLPIQVGGEVDRSVLADLFGTPKIPASSTAVAYNLTATKTSLRGWLSLFPANVSWPGTSSVNWSSTGLDISNGGIVAIGPSGSTGAGSITVRCGGTAGAQTHVLIDITGYFVPAT